MLKIAIFPDLLDFVEYSTGVEYSMGHEKFFLNYKIDKDTSKNFHVSKLPITAKISQKC